MNLSYCIDSLQRHAAVFTALLRTASEEQAVWKPSDDKWSQLEVINHVADEEVEDFGTRLRLLLTDPALDWPPIDPPRWCIERQYNTRNLEESLNRFVEARRKSIEWLQGLPPVDWKSAHVHPKLGEMRAGDLLYSWVAHDLIHIRQITRLHYEYLRVVKGPFSVEYAGNW